MSGVTFLYIKLNTFFSVYGTKNENWIMKIEEGREKDLHSIRASGSPFNIEHFLCLSVCLFVQLFVCLSVCLYAFCFYVTLSFCPSAYMQICMSVRLTVHLTIYLLVSLSFFMFIYLSVLLFVFLTVCLSIGQLPDYVFVCQSASDDDYS